MKSCHLQLLGLCVLLTISAVFIQTGSAAESLIRSEKLNATIQEILSANDKIFEYGAFGNKVYFSDHTNTKMTFTASENFCANAGLKLVRLNSQQELTYLGLTLIPTNRYWLDGYDKKGYFWVQDGDDVEYYVNSSHPNCIMITNGGKLWGDQCDASLSWDYFPLCQFKADLTMGISKF